MSGDVSISMSAFIMFRFFIFATFTSFEIGATPVRDILILVSLLAVVVLFVHLVFARSAVCI